MRKNLVIKILVLLIAILLWLQQVLQKTHNVELLVPISLQNLATNLVLEDIILPQIRVEIQAKGYDVIFAKFSNFSFNIDAAKYKYGKNKIKLTEKNLVYPKRINLKVIDINYDNDLVITVDRLSEKSKPVEIVYESTADEEFFIENKILNENQKVVLKGPLILLKQIEVVKTKPINKKMVMGGKLNAELISPNVNVKLETEQVVYEITQTKIINKTISLIPIKFPESENLTIIPQKVSIMISGPEEILITLNNNSFDANLDLKNVRKGFTGVKFDLPSGVKMVEYTPQRIQVIRNEEDSGI